MVKQDVCRFYKFGFCKYKDLCRNMHVHTICENKSCDVISCNLRHPRKCSYYRDFKRCKFSEWCLFDHEENNEDVFKIKEKLEENNKKIRDLEKIIMEKDNDIINIVSRIEEMKKAMQEEVLSKVESLEKVINDKEKTINDLVEKVEYLDKIVNKEKKHGMIKCKYCDFETLSGPGLKIHMRKKHTSRETEKYPIKCDLCEEQIETSVDLKKHMKRHSILGANFKCADCDFVGESELTMDVHNGKYHSENFECGICGYIGKSLDDLELHLFTCEIYRCRKCDEVSKSLSELRKHALENHTEFVGMMKLVEHIKMSKDHFKEVSVKHYYANEI